MVTVNHAWKQKRQPAQKPPKLVPIEQAKFSSDLAAHNATGFTLQMVMEQAVLMLHEEFGFGPARCQRALNALRARMAEWQDAVEMEFDAETFRMRYKEREAHHVELSYLIAKHDAALQPLVAPEEWKPWKERFGGFGGTGAWCEGGGGA